MPLYVLGRELENLHPLVPLAENTALGIAVVSYNGRMNFGLNADFDALADLETLAVDLREAIDELAAAAGVGSARPKLGRGVQGKSARARGSHLRPVPAD